MEVGETPEASRTGPAVAKSIYYFPHILKLLAHIWKLEGPKGVPDAWDGWKHSVHKNLHNSRPKPFQEVLVHSFCWKFLADSDCNGPELSGGQKGWVFQVSKLKTQKWSYLGPQAISEGDNRSKSY